MKEISTIFRRFPTQILYFITMPLFFFSFALLYKPFNIEEILDLGKDLFAFNVTIMSCIVLVTLIMTRSLFFAINKRKGMGEGWYLFWCFAEIVAISLFVSLYFWLMDGGKHHFFAVMVEAIQDIFLTLIFPYLIIHLALLYNDRESAVATAHPLPVRNGAEPVHVKFYDSNKNQKFAATQSSILYITAQDNYLRIYYLDNDKVSSYLLRNSITNVENYCAEYGLVRCHRSFIINSQRIKLLKKEKEGYVYAVLDGPEPLQIPVTKRYYDSISQMLS